MDRSLNSFESLTVALHECIDFFDLNPDLPKLSKEQYLIEIIKTFKVSQTELDLYSLFDASKPYTRNIVFENQRFALCLYCWNPEASSKIHDHPSEICLVMPLQGSLKIERYSYDGTESLVRNQVKFLLEGGQIAILNNAI